MLASTHLGNGFTRSVNWLRFCTRWRVIRQRLGIYIFRLEFPVHSQSTS